ncbi:Ig-like domain-containing protein, partial [Providencia sp. PROV225]
TDKGQLTQAIVKTDNNGVAKTEISSTEAGNANVTITVDGKDTTQTIEFISDKTTSTVTPNNIHVANPQTVANGNTPNPIAITVTDAHGNPVPNVEVQFTTDKGQLTQAVVKTDNHGVAKTEIASTTAGTATVTITVDGKDTTQTIEFISDKTTPQVTPPTLNTTQPQVANGKQPFEIKTQVTDANGNPIANAEVKWSSNKNLNEVSFSELTTLTNKDGYATTQVTSTIAENVTISATTNNATPQDITVQFVPDNSTATIKPTDLVISHSSSIADGSTPNTIEVTVTDAQGNKVPHIEVTFATNHGDLVTPKVTTDVNGVAKTQLTSTKTGNATVTVTVGGNRFDKTISFVANHQTAKVASVTAKAKNQYLADGKTTVTYTAKVVDANQNPVINADVDWSSDIAEVVFTQGTSKTDDKGIATVMITSTKAKPTVVTATTNSHHLPATSITFVADVTQAQITALNINKATLIANQTDSAVVDILITDNHLNPLENIAVTLTSNRGRDDNLTALTPLFKTDSKGYVKVEVNTAKAGDIILSAEIANQTRAKSTMLKAIADNTTASISIAAPQKTVQIGANAKKIRLTATVKDAQNNPLANTPVTWLSNHNQLSTNTTQTNNQGQAQVELSGYTAGDTKVTAQLLNNATEEATIQFIAAAAKTQNSILAITPQTIVANGQAQATATLALKDQWDNPVTGKTVQWDSNNSAITISDIRELPTNKGVYQAKISGTRAGMFELTAMSDTVTKKTNIGLVSDNTTSTINSIDVTSQVSVFANGVEQIIVQASITDASGNPAANVPVGWKTEIGELNQLISQTDYHGIAQVTLTSSVAGRGKVSAILGTSTKETANEITFLAGSVSTSTSTATLTAPSISAAVGKTEIIVNLKDDTGNRLWGLSNKIALSYSTDLGLDKTPLFTESQTAVGTYRAELSGVKAGKTDISIYVDGIKLDNDIAFTVTPNSQTAKVRGDIVPVKQREIVGNNVTYTATFEDANANLLGAGVPVFWTANDGTKLSTSQTTTDANGQSHVTVKRNTVGNAEVTINLTSQNNKTAPPVYFEQGKIDVSKTTLELTPSTIVAGRSSRLNIILKDQFGNVLTNQGTTIEIKSTNRDITIGQATESVLLPGNYQATVTSNKAGTGELSIKLNGAAVTQTKTLRTTGDKTSWHIARLESDNKTIKAGDSAGVTYKATVMDQYNNLLPDVNVSWHLRGKSEPFPHSSTTNAQGIAEIKLTSQHAGELIMNAVLSDKVEKTADAVQVVANNIDSQLSSFTTNKTDIGPDGREEVLLTVKLQDSFGNPVLKQVLDIKSNAAARDFIIGKVTEQQNGQYTAKATAALNAAGKGPVKLTVKVGNQAIAQPIEIKIDAITPVLSFDDNVKSLTYSSRTNTGQAIKGLPNGFTPRWSSDNTSIATVNDQGEVKLKKAGHTKIWARIDGNGIYKSAEVSYELEVAKAKPELKLISSKTLTAIWDDGSKPKIEAAFNNNDAQTLPMEFISKNANTAHVDFQTGEISQIKPGKAKLIVNTKETEQFLADSQEITYELAKARLNIDFAHSEQEATDEKAYFNLQQARTSLPAKAQVKWRSSDSSIVNISSDGTINRLGKGKAQLTLAIKNNDYYEDSEGSYTSKVYAKPDLPPINVVYRNNGKEERGGTQWLPVYTDDSMTVVIPPIKYTEYDKPSNVKVILRSGNREIESKELQDWSKPNTITYQPDVDFYKKDLTIEIRAEGKASLNIVANKQHDMQVEYINPSQIGALRTDYQPRYIITGDNKDDSDNKCKADADIFRSARHFMIQPITKLDIGSKKLLTPLRINHTVEHVKNNADNVDFHNYFEFTTSERYKFNSIERKYSVLSNCLRSEYGTGNLKTHLKFGDKSATVNEIEFYWEGQNRYPHKPSI